MISAQNFIIIVVLLFATSAISVKYAKTICDKHDNLPVLKMGGFRWAENMAFANGFMFVSDSSTGSIWRLFLTTNRKEYKKEVFQSGFSSCLGLAASKDERTLYAVVQSSSSPKKSLIISMNTTVDSANKWQTIAEMPQLGNGLAIHYATNTLYSPATANFVPTGGAVYSIDLNNNNTVSKVMKVPFADGAQVDQIRNLLYVSEVVTGDVVVYDITLKKRITKYHPPNINWLDDFYLTPNGDYIFGADYKNGTVVGWKSDGKGDGIILASNLSSPSSVRAGQYPNFSNSSLYVSQSGGLLPIDNGKVIEIIPCL